MSQHCCIYLWFTVNNLSLGQWKWGRLTFEHGLFNIHLHFQHGFISWLNPLDSITSPIPIRKCARVLASHRCKPKTNIKMSLCYILRLTPSCLQKKERQMSGRTQTLLCGRYQEPPSWLPGAPTQIRRTDGLLNASIAITGAKLTSKNLRCPLHRAW